MAIVKKFTIGVAPFAQMFRIHGLGGSVVDAVLALRKGKSLSEDYFSEVAVNAERTVFQLRGLGGLNAMQFTDANITFTKDFYESEKSFDFRTMLDEFRAIWPAVHSTLNIQDIRRIGMVAEHSFKVESKSPSAWLRQKLTTFESSKITDKFLLRFEERELAQDGNAPDLKKSDFLNYIYQFNDSALDAQHPSDGSIRATLDVQRYFAPVLNGNVGDEVLKLKHHFELAQKRLDEKLKGLGASYGKR